MYPFLIFSLTIHRLSIRCLAVLDTPQKDLIYLAWVAHGKLSGGANTSNRARHEWITIDRMMVTERRLEGVVGCTKRKHEGSVGEALEWRVLESGVLAVKTPLEVVTTEGKTRCIWFEPRKRRLVCPHGWGQYHLGIWNGPRAADFPKPAWTTCDCQSATGLCARQKLREEVRRNAFQSPFRVSCPGFGFSPAGEVKPSLRRELESRVRKAITRSGGGYYKLYIYIH